MYMSLLSIAHFVHGILGEHEFASKTPDPFIRRFETNWKLLDQILKDTKANGVSRCKLQTVLMKFISRLPLMFQKKDESGLWLADIPKEPWNPTTSNILPFWKRYPVHPRMLSLWRNGQLHINWKLFFFRIHDLDCSLLAPVDAQFYYPKLMEMFYPVCDRLYQLYFPASTTVTRQMMQGNELVTSEIHIPADRKDIPFFQDLIDKSLDYRSNVFERVLFGVSGAKLHNTAHNDVIHWALRYLKRNPPPFYESFSQPFSWEECLDLLMATITLLKSVGFSCQVRKSHSVTTLVMGHVWLKAFTLTTEIRSMCFLPAISGIAFSDTWSFTVFEHIKTTYQQVPHSRRQEYADSFPKMFIPEKMPKTWLPNVSCPVSTSSSMCKRICSIKIIDLTKNT